MGQDGEMGCGHMCFGLFAKSLRFAARMEGSHMLDVTVETKDEVDQSKP